MGNVSRAEHLRGVIGACLTPFTSDGRMDLEALSAQIEFLIPDVDAIAIGAVEASEYTVLSETERAELLRMGVEMVGARSITIAGASAQSIDGVLRWIDTAAEYGADMAQVLIPRNLWGGQYSRQELLDFFSGIAEKTPLPLVLYHNPASGSDPDIGTYVELSRMPNVVCFKESSRDITKLSRLIQEVDVAGNASYFTTMQPMLITLLLGGAGATMPPPATRIAAKIRDAYRECDLVEAVEWQRIFAFLPGVWSRHGLTTVMKAACRHVGLDLGVPMRPKTALPTQVDEAIGRFIQGCGLQDDSPVSADQLLQLVNGEAGPKPAST